MPFSSVYMSALSMPLGSLTPCTAVLTCLPLIVGLTHKRCPRLAIDPPLT
jgi:hypothetical protein